MTGEADDVLFAQLYDRLHALAGRFFASERRGHTLQPTALISEVYLRLAKSGRIDANGQAHFFRLAARTMRRVLLDHAKARNTKRRGGSRRRVTMSGVDLAAPESPLDAEVDVEQVDRALCRLAESGALGARQASVVELRFFAGLSEADAATALGVSPRTARNDWQFARAWLRRELDRGSIA